MSDSGATEVTVPEVHDNEQQREDEALAVITESDTANIEQTGRGQPERAAEGGATANSADTPQAQPNDNDERKQEESKHRSDQSHTEGEAIAKQSSESDREHQDNLKQTEDHQHQDGEIKTDKAISVGTSTVLVETQEVVSSSTMSGHQQRKQSSGRPRASSTRRASYQSTGRGYAGGSFQNYGLTYLPYKSNFEPSEDARRRADEYFKTLKL